MDTLIDKLIAAVRADDYDAIAAARAAIDDYVTDLCLECQSDE